MLQKFTKQYPDVEKSVNAWQAEANNAQWLNPAQLKDQYGSASILKNKNVIFNICGNKYRLWVKINYEIGIIYAKAIGTHKEYETWEIT